MHGIEKRIVYIIRSDFDPSRHYVGITNDVVARLNWHNTGPRGHTVDNRPWSLVVSLEFPSEQAGRSFRKIFENWVGARVRETAFRPLGYDTLMRTRSRGAGPTRRASVIHGRISGSSPG
jgi:predicted GIY-YIG superfamily endonuclease